MRPLKMMLPLALVLMLSACAFNTQQNVRQPTAQTVASATDVRIIRVSAENWKFTPNVIQIKKGEKVRLQVTGISGTHSFAVSGLNINVPVAQGQMVIIDLPTDTVGTFDFRCAIPCGSGHNDMTGQIIIEA